MIDIVKLFVILKKILFTQNRMGGTKTEHSSQILNEISKTCWYFNRDKNYIVLFFLTDMKWNETRSAKLVWDYPRVRLHFNWE